MEFPDENYVMDLDDPGNADPGEEEIPEDDAPEETQLADGEGEGEQGLEEPETTTPPVVDEAVQEKLARLDKIEKDYEIQKILQARDAEERAAREAQARQEAERTQVENYFAGKKQSIIAALQAEKITGDQFVEAMDALTLERMEVRERQLVNALDQRYQQYFDQKLNQIGQGYREVQAFQSYAPELVEAAPQLGDMIQRWRMAGIPQEEISLLVEAGRKAYKVPAKRQDTQKAQEAARRAGAMESPTRTTRNTKASEAEEDKEMRKLAKEFFS